MHSSLKILCLASLVFNLSCTTPTDPSTIISGPIPSLQKQGNATQLLVDDKPFIILGGELGNSTFTSVESMEQEWADLKAMNLNTVLAPVYWEMIEATEGIFDFVVLDQLLEKARENQLKVVLLWFGSWKNSMSSHAPAWVKTNQEKYPRVKDDKGQSHEILTPFDPNNLLADQRAFVALMQHLKDTDLTRTVIMVQVENEIGMLPTARDYHPLAEAKFREAIPEALSQYLATKKEKLVPEFREVWSRNGFRTSGTWEEVFGAGPHTDELFMAWYFGTFTNTITAAGKEVYPLPMFANAALNRPGKLPGEYPSAGPLPHLMNVWTAAAPAIDFLSPDFYNPDFQQWCDLFVRQGNPLFIPEHQFDHTVAAKAIFSIGHYESMGFSPFSIESKEHPENEKLGKVYALVRQLTPLITDHQGKDKIDGVLLDKEHPETVLNFKPYEFKVRHSHTLGWEGSSKNDQWDPAGALIIQTGEKEFYVAGSGIVVTFRHTQDPALNVGILKNEEGYFEEESWKVKRYLNGDQTHQGRHIRMFLEEYMIQRLELYEYR